MIEIDGTYGEGGGQILRTSLALSLVTGKPFTIKNIRGNRKRTGLLRQHFTAVNAAKEIGQANVEEFFMGSETLCFAPSTIQPGDYRFSVGSAGSAMLVFQTILPALMLADGPSQLTLEGGTHNPWAPPFNFVESAFLLCLNSMGPKVAMKLERYGFYPAGGGSFDVSITPSTKMGKLNLMNRGSLVCTKVLAQVANIPQSIAEREALILARKLNVSTENVVVENLTNSVGPGNIASVMVESEFSTEVFVGFGERGVSAERVAKRLASEVNSYLIADVAVGQHLADQLLIPMALGKGGEFTSVKPTLHTETNIEVIKEFLDVDIRIKQLNEKAWSIKVAPA